MIAHPRVLILDDDDDRINRFALFSRPLKPEFVVTADQAIRRLLDEPWDFVFLDHDLELSARKGFLDHGNGMDVVNRFVQSTSDHPAPIFIVHSINTRRGAQMVAALTRAGLQVCRRAYAWHDRWDLHRIYAAGWPVELERWSTMMPIQDPQVCPAERRAELLADWDERRLRWDE